MQKILVRFWSRTDGDEERWEAEGDSPRAGAYRFGYGGKRFAVIAESRRCILSAEGELSYRLILDPDRETSASVATPYGALPVSVRTRFLSRECGEGCVLVRAEYSLNIAGTPQEHALSMEFVGARAPEGGE